MRLQVNLIPAIAYALVTMLSHMAGLKTDVEKTSGKQQAICLPVQPRERGNQPCYILVAKHGQLLLSSGIGASGLVWKIPYSPDTQKIN